MVAVLPEKHIARNVRVIQNQEKYQKEYDTIAERFDSVKAKIDSLKQQIANKQAHRALIEQFVVTLKKQDAVTEFSDNLWYSTVDYVTVYAKNDVSFRFKNGTEIRV